MGYGILEGSGGSGSGSGVGVRGWLRWKAGCWDVERWGAGGISLSLGGLRASRRAPPSQCHLPGGLLGSRPGVQPLCRRGRTLLSLPRGPPKPRCPCEPAVLSTPGPGVFTRPQVQIFMLYRRVTHSQPVKSSAGLSHVSVDLHGHPVQDRDAPQPSQ